jgi:hypothetical protein
VVHWPAAEDGAPDFAAIDCAPHYRNRVHPFNCEYYRGDHRAHFLTAQLVCSLHGELWDLKIGNGTKIPSFLC